MKQNIFAEYSDDAIFNLIQKNNSLAFAEFYDRYWDRLYNVACNKIGDPYLAEDIVQELLVDIWERRNTIDIKNNIAAYIATALKYKIIKARLKQNKTSTESLEVNLHDANQMDYSAIEKIQFDELYNKLVYYVNLLPEQSRLVYKLSKEEHMKTTDIATLLHLTPRTVESHLYRAIKTLKKNMLKSIYIKNKKIYNFVQYFFIEKELYI